MAFSSETWVANKLSKMGYDISIPPDFNAKGCDIWVHRPDNAYRLCVEVKFSRQGKIKRKYPRWQWDVSAIDDKDRVLILIAEDDQGDWFCFVLPGHLMAHRTVWQINSHPTKYQGCIALFLENWETVDFMLNKRYVDPNQLALFEGMK